MLAALHDCSVLCHRDSHVTRNAGGEKLFVSITLTEDAEEEAKFIIVIYEY